MEKFAEELKQVSKYLRLIKTQYIPAYDQKRTMAYMKPYFGSEAFFSENYELLQLEREQQDLSSTEVDVLEMIPGEDGIFSTIYDSLNVPLEKLILPESRIVQIMFSDDAECRELRDRDTLDVENRTTQFLTSIPTHTGTDFYVYNFRQRKGSHWHFGVEPIGFKEMWYGRNRRRFIVPALGK